MNKEQKMAWLFLVMMAILMITEAASRYLLADDVSVVVRRTALLVFFAALAFVLTGRTGTDKVAADERVRMISYRASWFGFMGAFMVVLLYSFLTLLFYERTGAAPISFQTLELILTRQAVAGCIAMGTIRSVAILMSYREGATE